SIPGSVPDLRHTPSGCPFHPRCPERFDPCDKKEPNLKPLPGTGAVPGRAQPVDVGSQLVSCWARTPPSDA
ncbi:MAG: methionine ABC transporter ATP-binding protein, partial [Candidatus Omnitrophica bacterium]|nr:methionine ABC transporter ATP-binding protein [Candidatus Omnitrophota bacterium]